MIKLLSIIYKEKILTVNKNIAYRRMKITESMYLLSETF